VNKNRVFLLVMLMCLTGMGLASRDWQQHPVATDRARPYEQHLRMYEEIRPALLGADPGARLLCKAGGEE
jgi:hypothetical protein